MYAVSLVVWSSPVPGLAVCIETYVLARGAVAVSSATFAQFVAEYIKSTMEFAVAVDFGILSLYSARIVSVRLSNSTAAF